MSRLTQSGSNYLRSAAHQPVSWYEWGEEAFAQAQSQDKPILLDIGAVWCHWCHVIDRESYENEAIADLINRLYIPVKVDVDARPDIDRRYQEAVQAMTGQGGWPLTVFLTPEGQVIYGGTYFPPEDRMGLPGMKTLLAKVSEAYQSNPSQVVAQAKRLHEELGRLSKENLRSGELTPRILERITADIQSNFDEEYGGFGEAPKFPPATALSLLLNRYADTGEAKYLSMVTKTLDGMSQGGMRDQLGGAFHRYSTDRHWRVPHFEVMLYVNAELLSVYSRVYALTGDPNYSTVIVELLGFLKETLCDQERGGFFGSQDADSSPEDDGDYWTWSVREATAVLSAEEFEAAGRFYGIESQGEMRENPEKNVLYETVPVESLAKLLGKPQPDVRMALSQARGKLLEERRKRKAPFVDRIVYVHWNGLMVSGLLSAYRATGDRWALDFSLKTLDRIWVEGYAPHRGLSHIIQEKGDHTPGFLEDYAYLMNGFLDAFTVTQNSVYLERAKQLAEDLTAYFWDPENGGFFDNHLDPKALSILQTRRKPVQDAPTPAGNSMAALGLLRLFHLTGESRYEDLAKRTLISFAQTAEQHGSFSASFGIALGSLLSAPAKVVVLGESVDPRTQALFQAALSSFRPNACLMRAIPGVPLDKISQPVAELVGSLPGGVAQPTAFVCIGTRCAPPVIEPRKLKELLDAAGKNSL